MSKLIVRHLKKSDKEAFEKAILETKDSDPNFAHYFHPDLSYADYVEDLLNKEKGINLPEGHVRGSCLYGFVDNKIVGRVSIRYELTDFLKNVGGHIGYVTVPNFRKKGYATEMLKQSLLIAKKNGLNRVLLTCDNDNIGSILTIEKCGGVLENIYRGPEATVPKRRYWIDLFDIKSL